MKIRHIFIANIAEIAHPITKSMTPSKREQEIFEDHAYCDRFVLSDKDNRLLITPLPIDRNFTHDIETLLRFRNVEYLSPKKPGESICETITADSELYKKLTDTIYANPDISISSYCATEEFKDLIDRLRKEKLSFRVEDLPNRGNLWTASFFDSKAGFRQAVNSLKSIYLTMPRGVICTKKSELIGWIRYFLKKKKGVVLKSNRGLAGAGLAIIHSNTLTPKDVPVFLNNLYTKEPFWKGEPVVVEEYIEPNMNICGGAPNIEMVIHEGTFHYLYECGMRISNKGIFMGTEFGRGAVSQKLTGQLRKAGRIFGDLLRTCGYNGHFEIDFVYGKNGSGLYSIEANLRRTGGTHAYEFVKRLLGNSFVDDYYIISMNKIPAENLTGKKYTDVKRLINNLLFPVKGKKEGIVISTVNYLKKGVIGYIIIGESKERVYAYEKEFHKAIGK